MNRFCPTFTYKFIVDDNACINIFRAILDVIEGSTSKNLSFLLEITCLMNNFSLILDTVSLSMITLKYFQDCVLKVVGSRGES